VFKISRLVALGMLLAVLGFVAAACSPDGPPVTIEPGGGVTTEAPGTTNAPDATAAPDETTTTTLPPDIAAFMEVVDGYESTANAILADINDTNTAWEDREGDTPSFVDTLHAFEASKVDAETLRDDVAATTTPDAYTEVWPEAVSAVEALPPGVNAIIEGLRAPDDGTARREAVAAYSALNDLFLKALGQVRAATP